MNEDLNKYNPEGSELRNLQMRMLDILIVVTDICDKHNIPYWISGGTLLGAMRHGGFIPWDDDIDIEVMHSDYKKLAKILPKELPDSLYFQSPKEKSYRMLFAKVRDRFSIIHSEEEDMATYKEKGVYIDIFIEERSYRWMKNIVDFFYGRAFRRLKRGRPFQSLTYLYEYTMSLFMYPIGVLLMWIARGICTVTRPNNILHSYGIGNSTNHNASYMFPVRKIIFEGKEFFAPKEPHIYLTKQYGDYMSIPPKDKRATHFMNVEYIDKL